MPAPEDLAGLSSRDWQNLEQLADSLEEGWRKGGGVDLALLLPPAGTPHRATYLLELIKTDLECRWRHQQPVELDYYLAKFPNELGTPERLPPDLVFEEYRVRQLFGDRIGLDKYKARFPVQFADVERLVEQHSLPTAAGPAGAAPAVAAPPVVASPAASAPVPAIPTPRPAATPPAQSETTSAAGFGKNIVLPQTGSITMIERIGTGGFAEVWKVQVPGGVLKALKIIIRPFEEAEAQRESEALELIKNNLRHHFLLPVHSFWPQQDRLLILMDLADGSLRDRLNKCKKDGKPGIPQKELLKYTRQAAEALDYLHSRKVQHRDIKPENILLVDGNVRVADFGLAKAQGSMGLASGTFAGTPQYMPPEVWEDKTHLHGDQYSLAASYFEMRVGRRLYKTSALPSLMQSVLHDIPDLGPLEPDVQKVLLQALAKNPAERFPTCGAFVEALEQAEAPPPTGSHILADQNISSATISAKTAKPSWRHQETHQQPSAAPTALAPPPAPWLWRIGFALALLGLCAMAAWFWIWPHVMPPSLPGPSAAGAFRAAPGTAIRTLGKKPQKYYEQIDCMVGATSVRFLLIPYLGENQEEVPFYIMEDKVWNGLFATYLESQNLKPAIKPADLPILGEDYPSAYKFAQWLGGTQGYLPTTDQWDTAAGRWEEASKKGDGPFLGKIEEVQPDDIALDRKDPLPVGKAPKDRSVFGCHDMAGNGLEWTRNYKWNVDLLPKKIMGAGTNVQPGARAVLRGGDFREPTPYLWERMSSPDNLPFFPADRSVHDKKELAFIGFRVVIEPAAD